MVTAVQPCAEELERAARLHREEDRNRFLLCRATLRALLARYVEARPEELPLAQTPTGKLILASQAPSKEIHFNLAHSHGMAVWVFASRPVGIDLELLRDFPDDADIVDRYFSPAEAAAYAALPKAEQARAFFLAWTRKEAVVKATGEGLLRSLSSFTVAIGTGEPAILEFDSDRTASAKWQLWDVGIEGEYVCSVAIQGTGFDLKQMQVPVP
jgi:4'-phosphopantetheinyl transferase